MEISLNFRLHKLKDDFKEKSRNIQQAFNSKGYKKPKSNNGTLIRTEAHSSFPAQHSQDKLPVEERSPLSTFYENLKRLEQIPGSPKSNRSKKSRSSKSINSCDDGSSYIPDSKHSNEYEVVEYISPNKFVVQITDYSSKISKLESQLEALAASSPAFKNLKKKNMCLVKLGEKWCRAIVQDIETNKNSITVSYLDYDKDCDNVPAKRYKRHNNFFSHLEHI